MNINNPQLSFQNLLLGNKRFGNAAEPFAEWDYIEEIAKKNEALTSYWNNAGFSEATLKSIAPSLHPRHYRTTSKRKAIENRSQFRLALNEFNRNEKSNISMLDCDMHNRIYASVEATLKTGHFRHLRTSLNYVVLRGADNECALIFNVHALGREIVRESKILTERLQKEFPGIVSTWIYYDPSRSRYYLEQKRLKEKTIPWKKLSGFDFLRIAGNDMHFYAHPLSFSQINPEMAKELTVFSDTVFTENSTQRKYLLDLYCGYGLFSFSTGKRYQRCIGIDGSDFSITSAKKTVEILQKNNVISTQYSFVKDNISVESLQKRNIPFGADLILDPPKNGVSAGVIPFLASRQPNAVLHVFCGAEVMPKEIKEWQANGYAVVQAQPFDMFAGTAAVEMAVVLKKQNK